MSSRLQARVPLSANSANKSRLPLPHKKAATTATTKRKLEQPSTTKVVKSAKTRTTGNPSSTLARGATKKAAASVKRKPVASTTRTTRAPVSSRSTTSTAAKTARGVSRTTATSVKRPRANTIAGKTKITKTTKSAAANSPKLEELRAQLAELEELKVQHLETITLLENSKTNIEAEAAATKADLIGAHETEVARLDAKYQDLETNFNAVTDALKAKTAAVVALEATIGAVSAEKAALQAQLSTSETLRTNAEANIVELKANIVAHLATIAELEQKSRDDELVRRRLHNTIQELKGNIRVFCRVRPLLGKEVTKKGKISPQHMAFEDKDGKQLKLQSSSDNYAGKEVQKNHEFAFDKVFSPESTQGEVFEEISQLVQSALDGYNICIFAYGQTGSGKTHTMEGSSDEESRGVIPRAVEQIFESAESLAEKGWNYTFKASFLEIYNETIRDLLGDPQSSAKHDIKKVRGKSEVYVTDLTITDVSDAEEIQTLLKKASNARAVAATHMNERSSRSHSVFQLYIVGKNTVTGDSCDATLNLVDLAGSERLDATANATKERVKETQNINKSLSNLGNVIMALGNKEGHIPYRNSKLTYLLQSSLGGNSKSLMFVNVSPREDCTNETVNSLRFATKVNQCNIGTARKVASK